MAREMTIEITITAEEIEMIVRESIVTTIIIMAMVAAVEARNVNLVMIVHQDVITTGVVTRDGVNITMKNKHLATMILAHLVLF